LLRWYFNVTVVEDYTKRKPSMTMSRAVMLEGLMLALVCCSAKAAPVKKAADRDAARDLAVSATQALAGQVAGFTLLPRDI
jgi:hypothetical protein